MFSKKMFIPVLTGLLLTQSSFGWFGSSDGHANVQFIAHNLGNGTITQTIFDNNMVNSSASFYGQGISFVTINGKQYIARGKNMSFINGQMYVDNKKVNESDIKTIQQTGKTFSTKINPEVSSVNIPGAIAQVHLDPTHTGEVICDEGVKNIFTFSNTNGDLTFDMPEGIYSNNFTTTPCKILARLSTKNALSAHGTSDVIISNSEVQKISANNASRVSAELNNRFSDNAKVKSSGASTIVFHNNTKIGSVSVHSSGASNIRIKNLLASIVKSKASGASSIQLDRTTDTHTNKTSGAASVKSEALKARSAIVDASGTAHVSIHANEDVSGHASGCSSVRRSGNAKNHIKKSGMASVK